RGADGLLRVVELLRERRWVSGLRRVGVGALRLREVRIGVRRRAAGAESKGNGELDRSHGHPCPFHLPSFFLRSAIWASSSLLFARLLASVAFIFASSAAALASESCCSAADGLPFLIRPCAVDRYFSA